jgi:hypothetical protein
MTEYFWIGFFIITLLYIIVNPEGFGFWLGKIIYGFQRALAGYSKP